MYCVTHGEFVIFILVFSSCLTNVMSRIPVLLSRVAFVAYFHVDLFETATYLVYYIFTVLWLTVAPYI